MSYADKCLKQMTFLRSHHGLHVHCTFLHSTEHCSPCEDSKTQRLNLSKFPEENCTSIFCLSNQQKVARKFFHYIEEMPGKGQVMVLALRMQYCPGDGKTTTITTFMFKSNKEECRAQSRL